MTAHGAVPAGRHPDVPNPAAWAEHALWWSERCRSRALLWPAGENWFANDPLGPMPHTHPDASEIFFVASGTLQVTVGRTELVMNAGDFCLVPPDTYHEPLNVGGTDLCVFVLVCPNWRDRRWKPEGFVEDDFRHTTSVVATSEPGRLPSDHLIESEVIALGHDEALELQRADADHVLYVLDGRAEITVEHLTGALTPHQFVTVMAGASHAVAARDGGVRLLSIWAVQVAPALP